MHLTFQFQYMYDMRQMTSIYEFFYFKVLLEWIQFWYDMVTLVVQNNIQKTRTQNMQ